MTKLLPKFGERQLVMVSYACGFNQSETGKYFDGIMVSIIPIIVPVHQHNTDIKLRDHEFVCRLHRFLFLISTR